MAYAAYRDSVGWTSSLPAAVTGTATPWMVMDVTVHSRDAVVVRRALAGCAGAAILRCIPHLDTHRARLEIRLPGPLAGEVMHRVMVCVPDGEIGHMVSWHDHLQHLHHRGMEAAA
jgi:hypothetical protein